MWICRPFPHPCVLPLIQHVSRPSPSSSCSCWPYHIYPIPLIYDMSLISCCIYLLLFLSNILSNLSLSLMHVFVSISLKRISQYSFVCLDSPSPQSLYLLHIYVMCISTNIYHSYPFYNTEFWILCGSADPSLPTCELPLKQWVSRPSPFSS